MELVAEMDISEARVCLPDYQFVREMDPGAQGDVFLAVAPTGEQVVVKVISGTWIARGEREIRALRLLSHPSIVRLVDSGTVTSGGAQLPFMATELVEGEDLQSKLDDGTYDVTSTPCLLSSLAEGLDAIWSQSIVHRDIKPANIVVRPDRRGVLLDLGIARCLDMTAITVGWGSPGTIGYASPEQARGERNLTVKSDVYSLGVTAYEAIVGDHPFGRDQDLMVRSTRPPRVPSGAPCSVTTASLIAAMMEPIPAMRPLPREIISMLASEVN